MKNILIYLTTALIITSCSDREDVMADLNSTPNLEITKNGVNYFIEIYDTLKVGYELEYNIKDSLAVTDEIFVRKVSGMDSIMLVDKTVIVKGVEVGDSKFEIVVTNMYKQEAKATLALNVFENISPTALITLSQSAKLNPYEIFVDASKSFDGDKRFGGIIVLYEYKIQDNYTDTTKLNQINYIFNTIGQKKVTVRVKDNDGVWSDEITKYIVIE